MTLKDRAYWSDRLARFRNDGSCERELIDALSIENEALVVTCRTPHLCQRAGHCIGEQRCTAQPDQRGETHAELRERVARVIAPSAFYRERKGRLQGDVNPADRQHNRDRALAKADAILSLLPTDATKPEAGGELAELSAKATAGVWELQDGSSEWVVVRPADLEKLRELSGEASRLEGQIDPNPAPFDRANRIRIKEARDAWKAFDAHLDALIAAAPSPQTNEVM